MDRRIEVKVFGNHLWKDGNRAGVQGEGNVTSLRISFDEGWDEYAKSITFFDAKGRNPVKRILTTDLLEDITNSTLVYLCKIPPEPLAEAGWCSFVVDGYIDEARQRSVETQLEVLPARDATGATEPSDPTPSQAEQLQAQLDAIIDDVRTAAVGAQYAEQAVKYAAEAQASAAAAAESEESAATSAASASDSAERAEYAQSQMGANAEEAAASAAEAKAAQAAATKSASDAEQSATVAASAASGIQDSVDAAAESAAQAKASAQGVSTYADEAKASAAAAKTSETNAASSASKAKASETNAAASAASVSTAKSDAEKAATRAETAKTAAESANTAAQTAKTAAETAKSGAESAKTAAQAAQSSAETAKTAAQTAQNKAEAAQSAAESAKAAAISNANDAIASAEAAELSETNAASSASAATSAADRAQASASEAAQNASAVAGSVASAAESAESARLKAEESASNASLAQTHTTTAWEYMTLARESATDAETAQTAAEAAKAAAEKAAAEAQQAAGGDFATPAYVDSKAAEAESKANTYTDQKFSTIPTPDVSGQIGTHNTATDAHADIRERAEWAIQNAMNAYEHADTKAHFFYCYLDETSFDEVNDEYTNGRIVTLWDNNELWPLVYAEENYEYRFRIVDPDGVRTATLTEDGWSNTYDGFSSGGSAYSMARIGWVELPADAWESDGNLHSQVVDVEGVTEYSQVDLTPSVEQLAVFYEKDLTFVTENEDGVVTVYAIGQKPTNDYTIQVTITEVEV